MLQQAIFYPLAIPESWDNIEVHPVFKDEDGIEEICEPSEASFYGVYLHDTNGGILCVADCPTDNEAHVFADLIAKIAINYKDPEGYLLSTLNYKK